MMKIVMLLFLSCLISANDLVNVNIQDFTNRVSKQTNKIIYINKDINSSISLFIPNKINDSDIFKTYKILMNDRGYLLQKKGDFYYLKSKKSFEQSYIYNMQYSNFKDIESFLQNSHVNFIYLKTKNAFVFRSTPKNKKHILNMLHILDIKQKQVMLKIMLFEYSNTDIKERGVQWGSIYKNISGVTATAINALVASVNTSFYTLSTNNFYSALHFLNDKQLINVKQFPYILSKNNQSFTFQAVDNIPYLVSTTKTDSSVNQEQNSIEYRDVGLKIKGKSRIYNDYISLDLSLIIEDIINNNNNMPQTYRRILSSNTNIKNNQVLILSGLKRNKIINHDYSIPFLSNIPYLGQLFVYKTSEIKSVNITMAIEVLNLGVRADVSVPTFCEERAKIAPGR